MRAAASSSEPFAASPQPPAAERVLPAKTPVYLRFKSTVGSKLSKSGDAFAYTLSEDVLVDGIVVLAAGTAGTGKIVHAKKGGGSGSGGELVLSPGSLELGEESIRLRSLRIIGNGKDRYGLASAIGLAPLVGPLGFLVKGNELEYGLDHIAEALTAEDHVFRVESLPAPSGKAPIDDINEKDGVNE